MYYICNFIKEPSERENRYNATITLSKDFKILKEEYSIELEELGDFETYKQQCKHNDKIIITFFQFGLV